MRYLLPLLLALAACSNDPTPLGCTPGAQLACACPGGASSVQVCTSAGTLEPCACPDAGAVDAAALDAGAVDAGSADSGASLDVAAPDGCTSTTVGNCCGVACAAANGTPACVGGACGVASCNPGFINCDGNAPNGCECHPAHAVGLCMAGSCRVAACIGGFGDCDGDAANGCEVDIRSSSDHCGACRAPCAAGRVCSDGACDACDVDGDGARARSCGGMDCDDNDPATYPGAVERCDGFDNNCDRMADDVEDFTARCSALVDAAFPETRSTSPAFCDQVPAAGRPAGAERFSLVCRRRVVVAATVRCVCVAANGARWECGCS